MTNKYYLFLDDERFPVSVDSQLSAFELTGDQRYKEHEWVIVRNFDEFVKTIEKSGLPVMISFDHDLKDLHYYYYKMHTVYTGIIDYAVLEGTGYECAKWLTRTYMYNNKLTQLPKILVHTQNTVGRKNIIKEFDNFDKCNNI